MLYYHIGQALLILVTLVIPFYCVVKWQKQLVSEPNSISRGRLLGLGSVGLILWVGGAFFTYIAFEVVFGMMIYAAAEPGASNQGKDWVILIPMLLLALLLAMVGRLIYLSINRVSRIGVARQSNTSFNPTPR